MDTQPYLSPHLMQQRKTIIDTLMHIRRIDADYARYALRREDAAMPWMRLMDGVREAMKGHK